MSARERLEKKAIEFQKLAQEFLSADEVKIASLGSKVDDAAMFDRDLSTILSILWAHDTLAPTTGNLQKAPVRFLKALAEELQDNRGFKLNSFTSRLKHIEQASGGTFRRKEPSAYGGGDVNALDKPLRRLREMFYEIGMHEAGHENAADGKKITKLSGQDLVKLLENLIVVIKTLETDGLKYEINEQGERVSKERTKRLDEMFDKLAAQLNKKVGSSTEGMIIRLLHIHTAGLEQEFGDNSYAVAIDAVPKLVEIVKAALPDPDKWNPTEEYHKVDSIVPEPPVESASLLEEYNQEHEAISEIALASKSGNDIVRVVRLPFTPGDLDKDAFATLELVKDEPIGRNISRTVIEGMNKLRFSGFVEFDQHYRMMIVWAIADDQQVDELGQSYRDMLIKVLTHYAGKFTDVMGQKPEVRKTKSGAAYYFPKATSVPTLIKNFEKFTNLLGQINNTIVTQEVNRGFTRQFNRTLSNEELPSYVEESA
jgi:hypothetical protein